MSVKITLSPYELSLLENAKAFVKLFMEKEGKYPSRDSIREHLGCGAQVARNLQLYLMDFYETSEEEIKETHTYKDGNDTWEIDLPKTRIYTLEQLLEHFKVDTSIWEVDRFTVNKWEMGMKSASDLPIVVPLYQVKAILKRKKAVLAVKEEIEQLKAQAKETVYVDVPKMNYEKHSSGLMLELSLYDIHFGKQSWPAETLDRPYDVKIAESMVDRATDIIIGRTNGFRYEKVLFVVGNDILHSNDLDNRTANGTIVDSDGRFQKAYVTARRSMVRIIQKLRTIAPVEVLVVPGNHDRFSAWTLGESLECYFHNDPDVKVDNGPSLRKYYEWGKVGLMLTHGDEGKREDFPLLFATEKSEMFGRTLFREIHTGHNHTTKNQEFHGVRVRILGSLSTADSWHAQKGFKGALRTAEAFVWSKNEGLIANFTYTDNAFEPITSKRVII